MKLKNLSNYTHQEQLDVLTQNKAHLKVNHEEYTDATLVNYQEQEENDEVYFEIYESEITVDEETTLEELREQQINNEKVVKSYKTKKGLLQAMLNDSDVAGQRYRIHTVL